MTAPLPNALPNCHFLGSPGRLPFLGHFRLRVQGSDCQLDLCGRIGNNHPPEEASRLSGWVRQALAQAKGDDGPSLMRHCWEQVLTLPRKEFGPSKGSDLALLMVATDPNGRVLSAVGLSGIWQQTGNEIQEIANTMTVETQHPGIPKLPPKALNLATGDAQFFASPLGHIPANPTLSDLMTAAGFDP